jgi:hypothetical protein
MWLKSTQKSLGTLPVENFSKGHVTPNLLKMSKSIKGDKIFNAESKYIIINFF